MCLSSIKKSKPSYITSFWNQIDISHWIYFQKWHHTYDIDFLYLDCKKIDFEVTISTKSERVEPFLTFAKNKRNLKYGISKNNSIGAYK